MTRTEKQAQWTRAIVRVGDGRGFILEATKKLGPYEDKPGFLNYRIVVTTAHCLPFIPPCQVVTNISERTYRKILGPLDTRKCKVWAECLFVDPIGDFAVLGSPDDKILHEQAENYQALMGQVGHEGYQRDSPDPVPALRMGGVPSRKSLVWVLSLDRKWVQLSAKGTVLMDSDRHLRAGMSGSPILNNHGKVWGVLCLKAAGPQDFSRLSVPSSFKDTSGPNPDLKSYLPRWLLKDLKRREKL